MTDGETLKSGAEMKAVCTFEKKNHDENTKTVEKWPQVLGVDQATAEMLKAGGVVPARGPCHLFI